MGLQLGVLWVDVIPLGGQLFSGLLCAQLFLAPWQSGEPAKHAGYWAMNLQQCRLSMQHSPDPWNACTVLSW